MRKVIVTEFLTVDGVMEDPGEWQKYSLAEDGDEHKQEERDYKRQELFSVGALLLGRVTYELFAGYWPSAKDEVGFADKMNSIPKYVISTSLKDLAWQNSTLIKDNVEEEVSKLKQQVGGDILVYGSAKLVNTMMEYNLVDEYRLLVHPIVVGSGKRLFEEGKDMSILKLVDAKTLEAGIVVLTYQPRKSEK